MRKVLFMGYVWISRLLSPATVIEARSVRARRAVRSKHKYEPIRTGQLVIHKLKGPITLDGRSDEPAWKGVEPLTLVMFIPNFGENPSKEPKLY